MIRTVLPVALAAALAACASATPEARLATSLTRVGIPAHAAGCFARDVTPRLSVEEVSGLTRAIDAVRTGGRSLTLAEAAQVARETGDARTLAIIVRAAALCV